MKVELGQKWLHFWNITLGPDIENSEIVDNKGFDIEELNASLERVGDIEKKYGMSGSNSTKGGKGKGSVVEKVEVDTQKAVDKANQEVEKSREEDERTK